MKREDFLHQQNEILCNCDCCCYFLKTLSILNIKIREEMRKLLKIFMRKKQFVRSSLEKSQFAQLYFAFVLNPSSFTHFHFISHLHRQIVSFLLNINNLKSFFFHFLPFFCVVYLNQHRRIFVV